ncbi:hypothetical protein D0576_004962 [Escherichia coli]|nr:hypothetical protein [Escherichia coli]
MDKDGAMAATGSFCSSGVISTGNNSTPVSEEVVQTAKINFCAKRILMRNQMSKIIRHTDTDERLFRLSKHHHLYEKKKTKEG